MAKRDFILIFDFGSQYTQLIARKIREQNIYCEVVPYSYSCFDIKKRKPKGIILSGGPLSIYDKNAYYIDKAIFSLDIPILGICYGMQIIVDYFGGDIRASNYQEFGKVEIKTVNSDIIFQNTPTCQHVWMSHADNITSKPDGFKTIASSNLSNYCALVSKSKKIYAFLFHPEVYHTQYGSVMLENFAKKICFCKQEWVMDSFIDTQINQIKKTVKNKKAICAISGGVDSCVSAVLMYKAIGNNLIPIFIDTGFLRKNERKSVKKAILEQLNLPLVTIDASSVFLERIRGVSDPEKKRKIIGKTFIDIFTKEAKKYSEAKYLVQGTLYTDIIESSSSNSFSKTIKSHHNVGGLPKNMNLKLIEPLKMLFKDEVRVLGDKLAIPKSILNRHPFPGPGLAIRVMGKVCKEDLELLRKADYILLEELIESGHYDKIWQAFVVLLDTMSVGVMGDKRAYGKCACIRAVESTDGMTATFSRLPYNFLENTSSRITNEVDGISRVVYDISSKPPSTIEWE